MLTIEDCNLMTKGDEFEFQFRPAANPASQPRERGRDEREHAGDILSSYAAYYNRVRTHLSLSKNAPVARTVQRIGQVTALPLLGGLHHQYVRI